MQPTVSLRLTRHPDGVATTATPTLGWRVTTDAPGWIQAWAELADGTGAVHRLAGPDAVAVAWPFAPLAPGERRALTVRAASSTGVETGWSAPLDVRAGFLGAGAWEAAFVGLADPDRVAQSALLRHAFDLPEAPVEAVLFASAIGAQATSINGTRTDDRVLAPGWSAYDKRIQLDSTDVTGLLRAGANTIGVMLAGAWRTEGYGFFGRPQRVYGEQPSYAAQLWMRFADGTERTVATGPEWLARGDGPITESSIYAGESVDLRLAVEGWDAPGIATDGWAPVAVEEVALTPEPRLAPPVRVTEELAVVEVITTPSGATVLDFGQNLVGRVRAIVDGPAGAVITLRHAEVLEHGEMGMRPLRAAVQTDTFTLAGTGAEALEPEFTFHGFRYVEVTGWPGELDPAAFTARVLHSDMARTARFDSSHPLVNRLHENVVWGMRGNFLSVPTDCPQRDERLGWTGDIQVFSPTAATLHDCDAFLADWLVDLAREQEAHDGVVPMVVPDALRGHARPAAAWGDAATVVPWELYRRYGDREVLADQLPSMRAWADVLLAQAGESRLWEGSMQFGDWLDPDAPADQPGAAKVSRDIVATAYVARSARIVSQAAAVLGDDATAAAYARHADEVAAAFRAAYVTPAGRMMSDAPTAYALAIGFDLVTDPESRDALGARLAERVRATRYRISTGFVGTPLILGALAATGHADAAARLLLQTDCPSWLYPVTLGATTIWERWDSMLPDGSINPGEMTSFNHYALGAVADWLHRSLAGLSLATPGGTRLTIAPTPVAGFDHASSTQETPLGTASSAWRRDGDEVVVEAVVPPNATATVVLPWGGAPVEVGSGAHAFRGTLPAPAAPAGPYSLATPLAAIADDPDAFAVLMATLRGFSEGYAAGFAARTSWTEGSALQDVLFGVPPHTLEELDAALAAV
ncbi:alpha-L-rhamnosidase [Demequina maris]|uniref:alpha-L-rhamnosidase n=1 Tax=Demequina maris TaxID=1638982 RepID=UPI0007830645|nr:alpha-L-rhamnosidase [Demequina maris]